MPFEFINPYTGRRRHRFVAFAWPKAGRLLGQARRAAALLRERQDELARLMALEMGKPLREGRAEAQQCAACCECYADQGAGFLADELVKTDVARSYVRHAPLGVVLAIMPRSFPLWQVVRFAAPALLAGNVALLKPAPNVPQCALALERIWHAAGLPPAAFRALFMEEELVEKLLADHRVAAVTLTGSGAAGAAAGRALKKTVLELGGSDPFVVPARAGMLAFVNQQVGWVAPPARPSPSRAE